MTTKANFRQRWTQAVSFSDGEAFVPGQNTAKNIDSAVLLAE